MKQGSINTQHTKGFLQGIIVASLFILLLSPGGLRAQTDSTAQKEETVVEEDSSLISPALEFTTVQKADNSIDLRTNLRGKVKGTLYKLPLLKISYRLVTDSVEKDLGFVISDREGKALLNVKPGALVTGPDGKLHFKAVFSGNKSMEAAEEEITIKRAHLEIIPVKEDSILSVKVKLTELGTGTEMPVPETLLGVFVKRSFNPQKIGEGTTDENGEAMIEIPTNLPGDSKGNITLLVKLDENEVYGNIEAGVTQQLGVPVSDQLREMPRALWSAHPPLWMLITFIVLMTAVWGHYIVIIYELFRLRKEEPHSLTDATKS